ncbi:MAG: hypothetical protein DRI79_03790 [Chloroflexi bacterium]|nr:MAG: hypothetical protein DRI79_03790 [Chloroflexota bacterium]
MSIAIPAVERAQIISKESVESLVEALFSLDEPWRGRFLTLVAKQATRWKWDGQRPGWEEMVAWLSTDPCLYREVALLLDAWRRPAR